MCLCEKKSRTLTIFEKKWQTLTIFELWVTLALEGWAIRWWTLIYRDSFVCNCLEKLVFLSVNEFPLGFESLLKLDLRRRGYSHACWESSWCNKSLYVMAACQLQVMTNQLLQNITCMLPVRQPVFELVSNTFLWHTDQFSIVSVCRQHPEFQFQMQSWGLVSETPWPETSIGSLY